jgi:hypothetical protein
VTYWIEVHCDVRSDTPGDGPNLGRPWCRTNVNDNPAARGPSPQEAAQSAIRRATKQGWVRRHMNEDGFRWLGWVCPHCQKFPPAP